jgi:hypothetical protein
LLLRARYGGTFSPLNPLVIKPGESVNFIIGPQYFLPESYKLGDLKVVPHVGAGVGNDPYKYQLPYPNSPEPIFTNNKVTFNSGDPSNPQEVKREFGHAAANDSSQYLIASGAITYNNVGDFVASARVQMIRHFYFNCSPRDWWGFVPNKDDLCPIEQESGPHSPISFDRLIDVIVSRLIKVVP